MSETTLEAVNFPELTGDDPFKYRLVATLMTDFMNLSGFEEPDDLPDNLIDAFTRIDHERFSGFFYDALVEATTSAVTLGSLPKPQVQAATSQDGTRIDPVRVLLTQEGIAATIQEIQHIMIINASTEINRVGTYLGLEFFLRSLGDVLDAINTAYYTTEHIEIDALLLAIRAFDDRYNMYLENEGHRTSFPPASDTRRPGRRRDKGGPSGGSPIPAGGLFDGPQTGAAKELPEEYDEENDK